ncbi:FxsB family radical SAM/SPASM domain protein [Actinomadura sp. KC345]|uniref:FxsB family cyclophane-forming radical SAM/SPASM peptide maturase n=1 Tax=Actinomadura sp. KC345 TaxID=2530371 RepID=UPI001046C8FB|nr:FxsB family cyclophane-forming radical SAM/SPASM peptide maturase [Actinomadura sp. KC345]TDC48336.1 FxsB family radical SAM/SPASM domain protein [Actinomadura sp. KC345]
MTSNARQAAPEWPAGLDLTALRTAGWRPTPFREFVLKIHGRCDLACDYCYMYEMADRSWRHRPRTMPKDVLADTAGRIAEHAARHELSTVTVGLHGGEPLLAGTSRIEDAVRTLRRIVRGRAGAHVDVRMQTNGVGLGTEQLRLCDELGIRIGVSLDGGRTAHDRHRRRRDGRGSHTEVRAALARLTSPAFRHLFSGLLCTIDIRNDPVETYEALLSHQPPAIGLLLPHGNWDAPPPGLPGGGGGQDRDRGPAPYADWLIAVFDRWYGASPAETRVRLFAEIIHLLLGGSASVEAVGLSPVGFVVVETDGSIEQGDALKSVYEGAPATGLHVSRDPFDAALRLPSIAARQIGAAALAPTCRRCPVHRVCGGGLYAHRHQAGSGFANPSVYCRDLFALIRHIRDRITADLAVLPGGGTR